MALWWSSCAERTRERWEGPRSRLLGSRLPPGPSHHGQTRRTPRRLWQDALWTASRKIDTFRGAAAFGTWLYRITANTANQKLRGRRSKRNEVSWEDLAPSFDDHGQYMEVAVDWSRRLTDPRDRR